MSENGLGYVRLMRHQLSRNLAVGAALATAGIVGSNAVIGRSIPAAASATSSSVGTPGSGSTDSSSVSTPGSGSTDSSVSVPASTPASVPLTPTPVAGSATQFSVVAGESATIIVDTTNGALRIVAFAPHPGWFTVRLEQASATEMTAQLQTDSTQVTFTARVADGALVAELSSGGVPSTTPGSTPGTGPDDSAPGTGPDNSGPDNSGPDNSSPDNSSSTAPDNSSSTAPDNSSSTAPDNSSSTAPDNNSSTSSPDDDGGNSGPGGGDDSGGGNSGSG
jgi:hypothetical protein